MVDTLAARLDVKSRTLALKEVPVPEPRHGEVRIAVKAARSTAARNDNGDDPARRSSP